MRELARQPFCLELRRCLGDERGDRAGLAADRMPCRALVAHKHLGRQERESLDLDRTVASGEAAFGQRLANARQILAELWTERLELRLDGLAPEPLRVIAHLEGLHVQLVADDRRELVLAIERAAVAVVRIEDRD